jgi:hypothetical protein
MRRRRASRRNEDPRPTPRRERATVIPAFDPQDLAREIEQQSTTPTITPPFDPTSYARIVDEHMNVAISRETPRTMTAATPANAMPEDAIVESTETIGRAMYGSYLQSDFPEALVLAERVLEKEPDHALAQLVRDRCRAMLSDQRTVRPSSVLRLKSSIEELHALELDDRSEAVLGQVDGITDAETIADLAGIPRAEALGRLHALLDLGVLELVSA